MGDPIPSTDRKPQVEKHIIDNDEMKEDAQELKKI
jgi:hypothetical protein